MNKYIKLSNFLSDLPDFVFEYIQNYYTGESINTQIGYSTDIRIFLRFLQQTKFPEVENIEDFTTEHLAAVKAEDFIHFKSYLREYTQDTVTADGRKLRITRHNSAYGINRKLSAVRGLFTYLYKVDKLPENITDKIDFMTLHQKIKKPLTAQETVRLIDVLYNGENYFEGRALTEYKNRRQRDIAIIVAYLGTGVRVSELLNLNIGDICFETSSFIVTRKGGDEQEIFMPVQVENELLTYMNERLTNENAKDRNALFISRQGTRMTVSAVEKLIKNYCHTVSITDPDKTRPHALRRTFACRLLEDGVDIKMVAELMGHKNIEVTHRYYASYSEKAQREVMRGLNVTERTVHD